MSWQRLVVCGLSATLTSLVCTAQVQTRDLPKASDDRPAPAPAPLTAKLVLTADEPALRRAWETARERPVLEITDRTRLGSPIGTAIVFEGCTPDESGRCDVTVDFEITEPSGNRKRGLGTALWTNPPIPGRLMLGSASLSLVFTTSDSVGSYVVHARLTDRVSGRTVELATPLRVEP